MAKNYLRQYAGFLKLNKTKWKREKVKVSPTAF